MPTKEPLRVRIKRLTLALTHRWLTITLVAIGTYAALPFVAPTFMKLGWTLPAQVLYTLYSPMCHQFAFRSIFLYGEQPFYPREIAHSPYTSYEAATADLENVVKPASLEDFSLAFIWSAREFVGNEKMGYKTALCARDVAIYVALFVGGLIYKRLRYRLRPLPVWLFVIAGLGPIGLDGFSQLLSYPPFSWWEVRETLPFFRISTGAMFGLMTAWLAFPYIEEAMLDTREQLEASFRAANIPF